MVYIYIYVCVCVYIHTHTHAHTRLLLSHEKNELRPSVATWMDLDVITLSELSQRKTNII